MIYWMVGLAILFLCTALFRYGAYLLELPLHILLQALTAYLKNCIGCFYLRRLSLDFIDQMMLNKSLPTHQLGLEKWYGSIYWCMIHLIIISAMI
jgi:hypothetical protein